jgi:UDP-N-acetylglucosamine transferase subunit ALG13
VVPRRQWLGEHVDDHQVAFSPRLAAEGGVFLAETEADLYALLDRGATDLAAFHDPFEHRSTAMAVRAFERLVGDLIAGPRPKLPRQGPAKPQRVPQ